MLPALLFILHGILGMPWAKAQASFATEPAGAPRSAIPQPLARGLEPNGTRLLHVVNGLRIPLVEIWWADPVPTHTTWHKRNDVAYGSLAPGTLLGVLYFPKPSEDFNHRPIQAGAYAMRYARMPGKRKSEKENGAGKNKNDADEEKTGAPASRYRDFVLLSEIFPDNRIENRPDSAQLSRQSQNSEPLELSLVPVNPLYKGFPAIASDDQGHCAVQFKVQTGVSGGHRRELGVAIVLVNPPNLSQDD